MMLIDDIKDLPASKWGWGLRPEIVKEWKQDVIRARPYVFDDDASFKLGQFIGNCSDMIAEQVEFAKFPFPVTYVELNLEEVIKGAGIHRPASGDDADWKIGFMCTEEGKIKTLVSSKRDPQPMANIIAYYPRTDDSFYSPIRQHKELLEEVLQMFFWGASSASLTAQQRKNLTDAFMFEVLAPLSFPEEHVQKLMDSHIGELRIIVAALLMLHQKRCISVGEKSWERRMSRGKSRVFMAHSTVTIVVDGPVEMRRSFSITDRQGPRAHEVPAHYCHRHGDRACEHVWIKRENEENHWDCPKCGRFRYLRREHMRGDASKGYVRRDYKVTTQYAKEMEEENSQ